MLRAITLSLVLLFSVGGVLPFMADWTAFTKERVTKKKKKKIKKYSKAWWKIYRAKMKRKKALMARKRAFAKRRAQLAKARPQKTDEMSKIQTASRPRRTVVAVEQPAMTSPLGTDTPNGWRGKSAKGNEVEFDVADESGNNVGKASLSVIGAAMGVDDDAAKPARNKTVGGVPVSALRRTVIDKMIKEEGWVVNDYQREINGKKVFVVVAQSPNGNLVQSRIFYFTEVDGRIYNLATNAPIDASDKIAADSEKVLTSLQKKKSGTTEAAMK